MKTPKIVCVVVTYNRLEKLKKAIASYQAQTTPFDTLIIVDNNSTDGTNEFLKEWKSDDTIFQKHIISLPENKGGSGGFYEGQKYAMSLHPEWIFVADDDAYPEPLMIEKFKNYIVSNDVSNISAICTKVTFPDGTIQLGHRSKYRISSSYYFNIFHIDKNQYTEDTFELSIFSYVGTFLNAEKLKEAGLVNPDLFIYADDGEHSLRMYKKGRIICVPSINTVHDSGVNTDLTNENALVTWRDYYLYRNQINMLKKHSFLSCIRMSIEFIRNSKNRNIKYQKVIKDAVIDGFLNRLGIHKTYKPGWSVKK